MTEREEISLVGAQDDAALRRNQDQNRRRTLEYFCMVREVAA